MTPWLWPTARAISWVPLAGVAACLVGLTAATAQGAGWPERITGLAAAAVAAGLVAGMRDPAAALLAAVPTSAAARRAHRLVLLVPTSVALWIATAGGPVLGLLALTAAGVAVAAWAGVPLGTATPLAWAATAHSAEIDWELRPELVLLTAAAALWAGRNR